MAVTDGILFVASPLTMQRDDYKKFVEGKFGKLDWSPLEPDIIEAYEKGARFLKWLYPSPNTDEVRAAHPYNLAAAAVSPYIQYNQNFKTGKTEYYDVRDGCWMTEGGESMIKGLPLQKVLESRLRQYALHPVQRSDTTSQRLCPVGGEPHPLLADPMCTNSVGGALKTIPKYVVPLGSRPESTHQLVCARGVTIDFSKPFDEQVRSSCARDRNHQQTTWRFVEPNGAKRRERRELLEGLVRYLNTFDTQKDGEPDIVNEFGNRFVELMRDGGDPMFQHVYFEPAGGDLNGMTPLVGLEEAIYAMRQDAGAASGLRAGMEEWVLEYGPLGNNGKGQKRDLREAALSRVDRAEERGYVAVVDDALLKDSKDESKCNEDKVKLLHSREAVIDEVTTDGRKFVNSTVRSYSGGGVVSGHGKNEKARNIPTNFLMRVLCNEFPAFDKPLKMPDLRRIALIYYPDTFQPDDVLRRNVGNPHYRKLVEYKLGVSAWVPDFIEWVRLLAPATKASGNPGEPTKRMWPRPSSTDELLLARLPPLEEDTDLDKFLAEDLVNLSASDVPASRDAVIRALTFRVTGMVHTSGSVYSKAGQDLRNVLVAPDKKWQRREGRALQHTIRVFTRGDGTVVTLSTGMLALLPGGVAASSSAAA